MPVIAATAAVPLAAASAAAELTAYTATTCGGADRLTLYITNNTVEVLQTFVDVDDDGDGEPDFGDGPVLNPGETLPLGYGLMENGTYTFTVSTVNGVLFQERVVLDCPPIGLAARIDSDIVDGTPRMTVHLRNETTSTMQTYIDLDHDGDGVPDSGDGPILAPGEELPVEYELWFGNFTVRVFNDAGFALVQGVGFAPGV
jgi:hypothetical protein